MQTYTIDSAPFTTYRYIGDHIDPERSLAKQAIPLSQQSNRDYRYFKQDIALRVIPQYKPNASWRALEAHEGAPA